jgi:hypothetical protein
MMDAWCGGGGVTRRQRRRRKKKKKKKKSPRVFSFVENNKMMRKGRWWDKTY